MRFSRPELAQLAKAWFVTALAFAIAITVRNVGLSGTLSIALVQPLLISLVTVGLGVILHELGHKFFGQRFGGHSEFRAFDRMLFFGLLLSFTGFLFILPGAVFSRTILDKRELGIVALAGPMVNLALGVIFIPFLSASGILLAIGQMGVEINFLLAAFNLLPLGLFDGAKVFRWNKVVWGAAFILAGAGLFFSYSLI